MKTAKFDPVSQHGAGQSDKRSHHPNLKRDIDDVNVLTQFLFVFRILQQRSLYFSLYSSFPSYPLPEQRGRRQLSPMWIPVQSPGVIYDEKSQMPRKPPELPTTDVVLSYGISTKER